MADDFTLNSTLEADTFFIFDLRLSTVRLMNDNRYPWIILVPKRPDIEEIFQLSPEDRTELLEEVNLIAKALDDMLSPTKINIAALGNMVRQLHVHIIARFEDDHSWPKPVWGIDTAIPYDDDAEALIAKFKSALNAN